MVSGHTLAEASAAEASEATAETAKRDSRAGARGWEAAEEEAAREREGLEKRGAGQEAPRVCREERGEVLVTAPERDAVDEAWMLIVAAIVKVKCEGEERSVSCVEKELKGEAEEASSHWVQGRERTARFRQARAQLFPSPAYRALSESL